MFYYLFCKLFNITREKYFLILPNKEFKEIKLNHVYDVIYLKNENKYYNVVKVTTEVINDTLVYNWINIEENKNL